jgi:SAM-dependent methyltransferase
MQSAQFQLHADLEDAHWWFAGRRQIMRALARRVLPPGQRSTVVDVGCGTGANIAALAGEHDCVGIDPSPEAIALARSRFPDTTFVHGHAPDDVRPALGEAALVLLMDVLEHVPDDFAFLSSLLAAMRPGAHLLLTVPADPSAWSEHDESNGHYRRYEIDRLERVWAGMPATPVLLSHYNARLYPVARAVRAWSRLRGRPTGRAGTDVSLPPRPLNGVLRGLFAGEARVLVDLLERRRAEGYAEGLSLVALLRREPGEVVVRSKPGDLGHDLYDPVTGRRHVETRHHLNRPPARSTHDVADDRRRPVL